MTRAELFNTLKQINALLYTLDKTKSGYVETRDGLMNVKEAIMRHVDKIDFEEKMRDTSENIVQEDYSPCCKR